MNARVTQKGSRKLLWCACSPRIYAGRTDQSVAQMNVPWSKFVAHGTVEAMAKKPANVEWLGFTDSQSDLLSLVDHLGNNGWARNSQTDEVMTKVLGNCHLAGLTLEQVKTAMRSVGYSEYSLRMLDRWERKRTSGRFDPPKRR